MRPRFSAAANCLTFVVLAVFPVLSMFGLAIAAVSVDSPAASGENIEMHP
jgi:hypothetical protein